jgi:pre-rRNA-processing protein TSR3
MHESLLRVPALVSPTVRIGVKGGYFNWPAHSVANAAGSLLYMNSHPLTVIVRHPNENPRKCSVLPLRGRADIFFLGYPLSERLPLEGYIRLAADGPSLSEADADMGILLLDGSWRWAGTMTRDFLDVPPRSLAGWKTAFPRVSKLGTDPDNGLASIEALFLAYHILGRPTEGLLDRYRWAAEFLAANGLALRAAE